MYELSQFGQRYTAGSGILQLMEDLGTALAGDGEMLMLGGGNPSHIPAVQSCIRERLERILAEPGEFERMIGNYDTPQGNARFIEALADLLRQQFGWPLKPENIVLTNGSQSAFFCLFNMFAGDFPGGKRKKILLPLAPEYIGYADIGLTEDIFEARKPDFDFLGDHTFKYRVNFDGLNITDDIGAICVSRPTNPTGNVLTDDEITHLDQAAKAKGIPLIIDNAYGTPFPHIIFSEAKPIWNENIILSMSLSKLGLPSTRTGIVIARKEVVDAISGMNAIFNLAPGGIGAYLAYDLVASGEIIRLSRETVTPYYQHKAKAAFARLASGLQGCNFMIHKPEGALFLWLWLRDLPIKAHELYERLKARNVLVVPGHYFFPGIADDWAHCHECLRITYAQNEDVVSRGLDIIADEVRKVFAE